MRLISRTLESLLFLSYLTLQNQKLEMLFIILISTGWVENNSKTSLKIAPLTFLFRIFAILHKFERSAFYRNTHYKEL